MSTLESTPLKTIRYVSIWLILAQRMQNLELKCVTYTQPIWLPLIPIRLRVIRLNWWSLVWSSIPLCSHCQRLCYQKRLFFSHNPYQILQQTRGEVSSKTMCGHCAYACQTCKFDFWCLSHDLPPIVLPILLKKTSNFAQMYCFLYSNLLKIHPIYVNWLLFIAISKFIKKHAKGRHINVYGTKSMWDFPSPHIDLILERYYSRVYGHRWKVQEDTNEGTGYAN